METCALRELATLKSPELLTSSEVELMETSYDIVTNSNDYEKNF